MLLSVLLVFGGVTYIEGNEEEAIKQTEILITDLPTEKQIHKHYHSEKYLELYKNSHEPHNKHTPKKIIKTGKKQA